MRKWQSSSEQDIQKAFVRVGLDKYIKGYFCQQNTDFTKPSADFYKVILAKLSIVKSSAVTMVGDSLEKDILPCHAIGFKTVWLTSNSKKEIPAGVTRITGLDKLEV